MKTKNYLSVLLLLVCGFLEAHSLERVQDFGPNPGHLRMFQYIPASVVLDEPCPLVLILHGSAQTAHTLSRGSGFNKLADSLGFIAIYPDQPIYNNLITAFSFYAPKKMKKGQGETASIKSMIDYCLTTYSIDAQKIYIVGMSAGAAMSNVMLNAYPEIFAAGALFAAPSQLHEGINTDRSARPRIAIIQGVNDHTVSPKHADKIQAQWETFLGFHASNRLVETNYLEHPLLSLTTYHGDSSQQLVRLDIAKTGHRLLIDPGKNIDQGAKYSLFSKDVDFHLPYWICEFFGLVKK
jgi:poly(3-hydroxybutyrate) depolymerase